MATNYTRWYRVGTANLTQGSKNITGSATYWLTAGLNPGDLFTIDGAQFYEVDSVTDNTHITLKTAYAGASVSGAGYSIVRNFTASLPAKIAANTAELLGDFAKYIDTDLQSIHGKSAYEVAVSNGFVGTEAQWLDTLTAYGRAKANGYNGTEAEWLESLKAAGEWTTLNNRTKFLTEVGDQGSFRNSIFRGKKLGDGAPTAAQYAAIANGSFADMYLGDYWTIDGIKWRIAGFNYYWGSCCNTDEYLALGRGNRVLRNHVMLFPNIPVVTDYYTKDEHRQVCTYPTSYFYEEVRPALIEQYTGIFGDHLGYWGELLPTGWTADNATQTLKDWTPSMEFSGRVELPTIEHLYGWRHTATDIDEQYKNGRVVGRLPLFNFAHFPDTNFAVRDIVGVRGTGNNMSTMYWVLFFGHLSVRWGNAATFIMPLIMIW